ncbi:MAG: zinc-binding dehydrogenase [Desulfobacterales bacterium]
MRSIYFEKNIPKIMLTAALRPIWPNVVFSRLAPTRLEDVPDTPLPDSDWVRVRNRLCGICASDLHLVFVEADPRVSPAALPGAERLYLGHEILGEVTEVGPDATGLKVGDRVIMDSPEANCVVQKIDPPCRHCREGHHILCENIYRDDGPQGTGGGWGDSFTIHQSGLYCAPDELDDETAMLAEPLSVGVRAALRRLPGANQQALVVGSGMIGLAVIAAVRALSPDCRISAMARYPQQAEMARKLGADDVIGHEDPYEAAARITGGRLYRGIFNNRTLVGGFDVVYDCVGTGKTVRDSLRWARAGGAVVLAGVYLKPMQVDLTPVWYQEIDLLGLLAHGTEQFNGRQLSTYELTVELLLDKKLSTDGFVTHRYPLERWREAVKTASDKKSGAIKVVLDYRHG